MDLHCHCDVFLPPPSLRFHDCLVETESPEQAGASWVGQQGRGRVARLHLPAVPDVARCQGRGRGGVGVGKRRLGGVFATLLDFFEIKLSMSVGLSPRPRNPAVFEDPGCPQQVASKGPR